MALVRYDEAQYRIQISKLQTKEKAAFATACAERLFPAYPKFSGLTGQGRPDVLREVLMRLWDDLVGKPMPDQEISAQLTVVMALIPSDGEGKWIPEQAAAEDAVAALAYSLRCRGTGAAEEAVWAARRAYEAIDEYVTRRDGMEVNCSQSEEHIVAHPLIQQELARQQRDIDELTEGKVTIEHLRDRSRQEAASFLPWVDKVS